ncbi:MAG: two-component system, cell cycle response regulator [Phormidesmis priestleyi Ana]|uniref:Two-component system, cell cycle response regulator n=1 Tax=Phormidesmis priestleyi Ana TaxID=1666911 RepID=A0A0P7ZNW9_9CYAN|nr:MAG: two-component system, cell cycle response regulator [Phormidesmis priestleyi Ana]
MRSAAKTLQERSDGSLPSSTHQVLEKSAFNQQAMQQGLYLLSQHPSIYSGDLATAAMTLTSTAATMLCVDRVTLWIYEATERQLKQLDSYNRSKDKHSAGIVLTVESRTGEITDGRLTDCTDYLQGIDNRSPLTLENVSKAEAIPWLGNFIQNDLIFHTPGAFLEMPIRRQGKVAGVLWYELADAHCWSELEQSTALAIALLAATAIDSQQQQSLSALLANHSRQLKRETIEREQAEQAWQESQRFIQGIIDASTNILYVDSFADGSNFYISRWIKNVLGYEPSEVQKLGPRYLEQLVHADEKKYMATERSKLAAINDGEVVENEYRFRHRQGNWRWLLCRETVFQRDSEGQPTQVFGTATDITKHKHAEVALKEINQELSRLASMDGLTKVANRRSFDQYLEKEWENVGSGRSSLSLILCDIDYFKNYNDTYGHQAGDVCLRQVAQAIERAVKRSTDLVARYGGEEFAVVLPNTSVAGVEQVAREIQREIQQLEIPHSCSEISHCITVSLGIAAVSCTKGRHRDMLVAAADQGLYQAKYEGRDRFCLAKLEEV